MIDLPRRSNDCQTVVELLNELDGVTITDWNMNPEAPETTWLSLDVRVDHRHAGGTDG